MRPFVLLTAGVAAAAIMATAPGTGAVAAPAPQHFRSVAEHPARVASTGALIHGWRHAVVYFRQKAWSVQRRIPVGLTPTNYAERHTRSVAFLHWLKHRWNVRWHRAKRFLAAHRLPLTNDWQTAVRIVQRVWSGTASWLLSCSGGEGGHGGWVWNGGAPYAGSLIPPSGSSGAGGWMQFMRDTFTGKYAAALAEARQRHWHLPVLKGLPSVPAGTPAIVRAWLSPLAQAFAAGWARYHHATSAWAPSIDPACA